ncbi:MAG: hypothetical protein JW787_09025 [Sedimentisphaerales bacterium]|nr:hypothetical protein [Sedimentisphaerales bacterium]
MNINIESLKEKKELVSVVLLGGAAVLVVLMFIKITNFMMLSTEVENIILSAIKHNEKPQEEIEKILASSQALADTVRANNAFAPMRQVASNNVEQTITNPVREVTAILGSITWINDQWYTVGDQIRGSSGTATVAAIETDYVAIEFNGVTENFYPLKAAVRISENSITSPNAMSLSSNNLTLNLGNIDSLIQRFTSEMGSMRGGRGGMMGGMMGGGMGGGMMGGMGDMGGGMMGGMGGGMGGRGGGMGGRGGGGRGGR